MYEFIEEIGSIVRTGRSFRVILNGEDGLPSMAHPFQTLIVQIEVGDLHFACGEAVQVHAEPVILGGDLHLSVGQVFDRLVGTPLAKF